MPFAERRSGQWKNIWREVTPEEVDLLRETIRSISGTGVGQSTLCDDCGIYDHDLKNFLSPKKHRPRHLAGLRMLHYASLWRPARGTPPSALSEQIERVAAIAKRISLFEPDEDYFFRHLQRLNVVDSQDCKRICSLLSGDYYSHRLSRRPNHVIRSHYEILPFNPYNRLPHFINKLRYAGDEDTSPIERTSRGQIFRMGDTYILLGFVFFGYQWKRDTVYDGIQINIFPQSQFSARSNRVIDGIFLSYVYHGRYEMGPMKLVRGSQGFRDDEVGEFPLDVVKQKVPFLDLSELTRDLSDLVNQSSGGKGSPPPQSGEIEKNVKIILESCLSFEFNATGVR